MSSILIGTSSLFLPFFSLLFHHHLQHTTAITIQCTDDSLFLKQRIFWPVYSIFRWLSVFQPYRTLIRVVSEKHRKNEGKWMKTDLTIEGFSAFSSCKRDRFLLDDVLCSVMKQVHQILVSERSFMSHPCSMDLAFRTRRVHENIKLV